MQKNLLVSFAVATLASYSSALNIPDGMEEVEYDPVCVATVTAKKDEMKTYCEDNIKKEDMMTDEPCPVLEACKQNAVSYYDFKMELCEVGVEESC